MNHEKKPMKIPQKIADLIEDERENLAKVEALLLCMSQAMAEPAPGAIDLGVLAETAAQWVGDSMRRLDSVNWNPPRGQKSEKK